MGFKISNEGVIIAIKVIPKANRNEIIGFENDELKIRLAAVPEKGEANDELIKFLSKQFKVAKSQIELISGKTSRHKRLLMKGMTVEDLQKHLLL